MNPTIEEVIKMRQAELRGETVAPVAEAPAPAPEPVAQVITLTLAEYEALKAKPATPAPKPKADAWEGYLPAQTVHPKRVIAKTGTPGVEITFTLPNGKKKVARWFGSL